MMKTEKLVRDNIPQIIKDNGDIKPKIVVLDEKEYLEALIRKLHEESEEFTLSHNQEELADILEVVYALAKVMGTSERSLNALRKRKASEKGRFNKRLKLVREA